MKQIKPRGSNFSALKQVSGGKKVNVFLADDCRNILSIKVCIKRGATPGALQKFLHTDNAPGKNKPTRLKNSKHHLVHLLLKVV